MGQDATLPYSFFDLKSISVSKFCSYHRWLVFIQSLK